MPLNFWKKPREVNQVSNLDNMVTCDPLRFEHSSNRSTWVSSTSSSSSSKLSSYSGSMSSVNELPTNRVPPSPNLSLYKLGSTDWFIASKKLFESTWNASVLASSLSGIAASVSGRSPRRGLGSSSSESAMAVAALSASAHIKRKEKSLNDFQQLKQLAGGTFGPIILLREKNTGDYFAVKVLKKLIVYQLNQIQKAEEEKRVLMSINFPFLINMSFYGQDSNNLYLYMEWMPGGDMWNLMQRKKLAGQVFLESEIQFYVSQVILGLEYLHFMNLIYRDLKPENIFIDKHGYVKIGDFGYTKLVKNYDQKSTNAGNIFGGRAFTQCGTKEYMAPEIVLGQSYSCLVDYWAVGILIYEFLTGVTPFQSSTGSTMETYEKIVIGKYSVPRGNASPEIKRFMSKFLTVDTVVRGSHWKHGWSDVKRDNWFTKTKFNWDLVLNKKIKSPFQASLAHPGDTKYFPNALKIDGKLQQSDPNNNPKKNRKISDWKFNKKIENSSIPTIDHFHGYFDNF